MRTNQIYVGIEGTVLALDCASGALLWKTSLEGWSFVNVVDDGDRVFALSQGEAYCLDARNGAVLWHNPLKGFGLGIGSLAVAGRTAAMAGIPAQAAAQQQDSGGAGSAVVA